MKITNAKNVITKIILGITSIFLTWILISCISLKKSVFFVTNPILIIVGIGVFCCALVFVYKRIIPKIKDNKLIVITLCVLFMILCIIFGQIFKVRPSWDMGRVYYIASDFVKIGTMENNYLYGFPNNVMITIVYSILFKIVNILFGITDYLTVATLFNSVIIGFTGFLLYSITKRLFDSQKAMMALIAALITVPFYLYCAEYYTDGIAMVIMLFITFLYLHIKEQTKHKKVLLVIFAALMTYIGMKIKISVLFLIIAFYIFKVINGDVRNEWKTHTLFLISFVVFFLIGNYLINGIVLKDKSKLDRHNYPYETWIELGLVGNGGFNEEIYKKINICTTKEEKTKVVKEMIRDTIDNYNIWSFMGHLNDKIQYAWGDGSFFGINIISREPVRYTFLHKIVLEKGKMNYVFKYYTQISHFSMLVLVWIGLIKAIIKKDNKNKNLVFYYLMLGFIIFFLIWENRSRYILPLVPFMIMMEIEGIEILSNYILKGKVARLHK